MIVADPELPAEDDITSDDERVVAGHVHAAALRERDHVIATIASHGNWVLASLLAANAGALAFVADSRDIHSLWPAAAFAIGGLLALASGIAQWAAARAALPIISAVIVPGSIVRRSLIKKFPPNAFAGVARIARAGIACAVGSMLFLSAGMLVAGYELQQGKAGHADGSAEPPG
jgi:hypothetical protein